MRIYQVDAFTDGPFRGNPAAVCVLPAPPAEGWMRDVAGEMNLSETAFLVAGDDGWGLRWFTPADEVDLCGHATLASAHILWEKGFLDRCETARFHTRSGLLLARMDGDQDRIELDFPAEPAVATEAPAGLLAALGGIKPLYVGKNRFDYLVEAADEGAVRGIRPDFTALMRIKARGIIVTAGGLGEYDFVSRFFAPEVGIFEDPVTGSAHCCLGPYWQAKLGKDSFHAYQASARGGELWVRVAGERVRIAGRAVTVMEGELLFSA